MLSAVSGWPLGRGTGAVLMDHICGQADARPVPTSTRLRADVDSLVDWYARKGSNVGRCWLGQAVMEGPAAGSCIGLDGEK